MRGGAGGRSEHGYSSIIFIYVACLVHESISCACISRESASISICITVRSTIELMCRVCGHYSKLHKSAGRIRMRRKKVAVVNGRNVT